MPWDAEKVNSVRTRTELLEKRKQAKFPHISYDLDKDGFVGGKDYFLAKRFDLDKDGKLNEAEKKAAYDEIAKGYEDNFIWNLDKEGSKRQTKIIQKRGVVIDADDYTPLKDTYPEHPMSKVKPRYQTKVEMEAARKKKYQ